MTSFSGSFLASYFSKNYACVLIIMGKVRIQRLILNLAKSATLNERWCSVLKALKIFFKICHKVCFQMKKKKNSAAQWGVIKTKVTCFRMTSFYDSQAHLYLNIDSFHLAWCVYQCFCYKLLVRLSWDCFNWLSFQPTWNMGICLDIMGQFMYPRKY